MPTHPLPPRQPRNEKVSAMVTRAEKQAIQRFAQEMGMSESTAARHLLMRALGTYTTQDPQC